MFNFLRGRHFWIGSFLGGALGIVLGFGLGVYYLPILLEGESASPAEIKKVESLMNSATKRKVRVGTFRRDLKGSDGFHWGEGKIILSKEKDGEYLTLIGQVSPGPDYRIYLAPKFVETEEAFFKIKQQSVQVGSVKTFTNFRTLLPKGVQTDNYPVVIIWCERFKEFISAATLAPIESRP